MLSRSPEEARLLDTAKRVLPGGILGGLVHGPAEVERTLEAIAGALAVVADRTGAAGEPLARARRS
jgi:hypothetical protein